MKRMYFLLFIFAALIAVIVVIILSIKGKNEERQIEINFTVNRVEITPALRAILYNKEDSELRMQRFVFFERHGIKPNDVIVKEAGAEIIRVYRKDSLGNNLVYLTLEID